MRPNQVKTDFTTTCFHGYKRFKANLCWTQTLKVTKLKSLKGPSTVSNRIQNQSFTKFKHSLTGPQALLPIRLSISHSASHWIFFFIILDASQSSFQVVRNPRNCHKRLKHRTLTQCPRSFKVRIWNEKKTWKATKIFHLRIISVINCESEVRGIHLNRQICRLRYSADIIASRNRNRDSRVNGASMIRRN